MSLPNGNRVRPPAVAGQFYPADAAACRAEAQSFLVASDTATSKTWIGGIVPHAGWICSGAVAGETIATVAAQASADVVVVFGAIHTPIAVEFAALDSSDRWMVPGGESQLPTELEAKLRESSTMFQVEPRLHAREHAVEVELPLIQLAWPNATVLPIEVPVIAQAADMGRATARQMQAANLKVVYLASSDFTHYGPNYRFAPAGIGPSAIAWAMENDRRLLKLIEAMEIDRIVPEVQSRLSACGAGAIAAMLAACREHGASEARLLKHTNSIETLAKVAPQEPVNSVGYAAVVIG